MNLYIVVYYFREVTMNFLFIPAHNSIYDILWALQSMNYPVDILETTPFDPNQSVEEQNEQLRKQLSSHSYDCVISYLFLPAVSDICAEMSIPYVSWTYDSPLISLFTSAIFHNTNYTFIFDKMQCKRLLDAKAPHIYHLPLAVNVERTGCLDITQEDEALYSHDISFVGGLYENNTYNTIIQAFPEHLQLKLKLYLMQNMCHWEAPRYWQDLPQDCVDFLHQQTDVSSWNQTALLSDATYLGLLFFPRKLAQLERITVLNTLAQNFDVHLYTKSPTDFLQNVTVHNSVDYYTIMNKIFYLSKINLNITLSSIETGIPQRILDIMGCGGFVLTNYQEELEDLFVIGKEIEVFRSIEELQEKCSYYLTHEKERLTIAINGYKKVRDLFSYQHQLEKIISIVREDLN